MSIIKAPFNFVPLNDKVFYPDWADCISQDVPFQDGESGSITLEIEAMSPIFVRNGNLQGEKADDKEKSFSKDADGNYFIPGSSIKGMLRSVLEVLSFGKLGIYNDDKYAVRDLSDSRNFYMTEMKKTVYCGWLKKEKETGSYVIEDCGVPGRISHKQIDEEFGTQMAPYFRGETAISNIHYNEQKDEFKSAEHKYNLFDKVGLKTFLFSFQKKDVNRDIYEFGGDKRGTVVFTGQPSKRIERVGEKPKGKIYEFIFFENKGTTLSVSPQIMTDFKFAYFDHLNKKQQSNDWKYWKEKLNNGQKIPVFFQKDKEGKVKHLGLSYLYKLPYNNRISDYLKIDEEHRDKLDLAECIFGCIEDKENRGKMLKGRVHVGHAKLTNNLDSNLKNVKAVLNSPKASYYPIYVEQPNRGNPYNTFMDSGSTLAGRKFYPIHKTFKQPQAPDKDQENVSVHFTPLNAGVRFQCKINYHNLRPAELGAFVSAITFHNTQGCFHSLGMGKPLGYGKTAITITDGLTEAQQKECLIAFEQVMNNHQSQWATSPQLTELITMASEQENKGNSELSYMKMGMRRNENEFSLAKTGKEALNRYSKLNGIKAKGIASLSFSTINNTLNFNALDNLKKQLENRLSLCKNTLGEKNTETRPAQEKTITQQKTETPLQQQNNSAAPQFLQKGKLSAGKRYDMEAVITKSGNPNYIKVYVKDGTVQENVKLDVYRNPLEVGKVIVVTVSVDGKEKVTQASFKSVK